MFGDDRCMYIFFANNLVGFFTEAPDLGGIDGVFGCLKDRFGKASKWHLGKKMAKIRQSLEVQRPTTIFFVSVGFRVSPLFYLVGLKIIIQKVSHHFQNGG